MDEKDPWPLADWLVALLMSGAALSFILLVVGPAEEVSRHGFSAVIGLLMALCVKEVW